MLNAFNSTRCIRNVNPKANNPTNKELSTPHGALGTASICKYLNSGVSLSTPHGALGTGRKNWKASTPKELSTPHGALGTRA